MASETVPATYATIKISSALKAKLDDLKIHPRETYNDVLARLCRRAYDNEPPSKEEIEGIKEAIENLEAGRVVTGDALRQEYRIG